MKEKIIIIEDEKEIADLVELYLETENFQVFNFQKGKEALSFLENHIVDLAIIDIMLPDISGFEIAKTIRESSFMPIIMLTAKIEDRDKILGLSLGADDYITKPFEPLELIARVKAQLRRYKEYNKDFKSEIIVLQNMIIDKNKHEVIINDEIIDLTPTEFSILSILAENPGKVISAEEIFENIWQEKYYTQANNTVMVHIRHIREKLRGENIIKTVWGVGYTIEK